MAVVVSQLVGRVSIEGADQAQNNLKQVGTAASNLSDKLQTIKPFNAGNAVSDMDVAQAKLTLLESKVSDAREKLQTLQDAADAGKSVKGIPEAEANLILLQEKAQQARAGLQELQSGGEEANAGLQQVDSGAQEASSGLSGLLSRLQETAGEMAGNFLSSVKESVSNLGGGLLGGIKDVAGNLAGGFLGSIKSAVGGIGDFINGAGQMAFNLQNLWNMSTQVASALLTPAMSAETMKTAFTTLMGSTKAATDEMAKLDAFASKTPFTTLDIDKAASQLIGFGTNAKDVIPDLTAIGDALSAVGRGSSGDLNMIVDIFGKIQTEGGLTVGTMQELSRDGINAWAIMEQQTGKTKEQLTKMIQAGLIPAKDAVNDLTQGIEKNPLYAGGMAKQSATMTGILSTLKSNWNQMLAAFGSPILKATEPILANIGADLASPGFKSFAGGVGKDIIGIFQKIGDAINYVHLVLQSVNTRPVTAMFVDLRGVFERTHDALDKFLGLTHKAQTDFDPLANLIGGFADRTMKGLYTILNDVATVLTKFNIQVDKGSGPIYTIRDAMTQAGQTFKTVWPEVQKFIKALMEFSGPVNLVQALARHSQDLGQWWQKSVVPALKEAQPHFASLGDALGKLVPMFERIAAVVHDNFQKSFDALLPVFEKAVPLIIKVSGLIADGLGKAIIFLTPYIEQITKGVSDFSREIAERVAPIITKWLTDFENNLNIFLKVWKTIWPYLAPFVEGVWTEIVGVVKIAWALVSGIIKIGLDILGGNWKQAWTDFKDMLGGIWDGIKTYLSGAWEIIQGMFTDAWKGIQAIFTPVGKWFADRFTEAKNGVTTAFGAIGKWFEDRWNDIITPLKPFLAYMGAVFQTLWNIIVAIMGRIGKWFEDRWNDIVRIFTPIGKWFGDRFQEAWKAITTVFAAIGRWFQDRWNDVVRIFTPVGKWFKDRFQEAWDNITQLFQPVGKWFSDRWADIMSGVNKFKDSITGKFTETKTGTTNIFRDMINGIIDHLNDGITAVENFINFFGQGLNSLAKSLGTTGNIPTAHLGRIAHYATGTPAGGHPGGPMIVGEAGPELLVAPPGTAVLPHDKTMQLLQSSTVSIPGYANGVGDIASNIFNWIAGGAQSVLDNVLKSLNLSAPNLGGLGNISSGIFETVKKWALSWIESILPKFSFGGAGGSPVNVPGNVQSWIAAAMSLTGVPSSWAGALATIAMHESGGNPGAVNNWDINAQNGDPSRGLFQTIGSTFAAYMVPGHGNILNPIDNAAAAIRYIQSRYGSVFNVPGIVSMSHGGAYQGYANGTDYAPGGWAMVGEHGPEMMYVPRGAQVIPNNRIGQASSSAAGQGATIILELNGRQFARAVLPDLANTVRYGVGTIGM